MTDIMTLDPSKDSSIEYALARDAVSTGNIKWGSAFGMLLGESKDMFEYGSELFNDLRGWVETFDWIEHIYPETYKGIMSVATDFTGLEWSADLVAQARPSISNPGAGIFAGDGTMDRADLVAVTMVGLVLAVVSRFLPSVVGKVGGLGISAFSAHKTREWREDMTDLFGELVPSQDTDVLQGLLDIARGLDFDADKYLKQFLSRHPNK